MKLDYQTITDSAFWHTQFTQYLPVFQLHQQLRPAMNDLQEYQKHIGKILDDRGVLLLAFDHNKQLQALALYRIHHNTYQHKLFFLEDLVVNEQQRGKGLGAIVLQHLETLALAQNCHYLSLDSGTFRTKAHKFYYTHDYVADCFHFAKKL